MFWDHFTIDFRIQPEENKEMQEVFLQVLERILLIEHRACREGALHGLGHMADSCPTRVRDVIDGFLAKANLDEKLQAYALKAREGRVQ